jgi:hypothetical protein
MSQPRPPMTGEEWLAQINATQEAAEARLDRSALIGKPVEEAKEWLQAHGFGHVLVEGSAHVLSFCAGRIRLRAEDGVVKGVSIG